MVSLLPLLRNPQAKLARQTLYRHSPHYCTRMTPASAVRHGDWKLVHYYENNKMELFNLQDDPGETKEMAAALPGQVRTLRSKLDTWRQATAANEPVSNPDWRPARK